MLARPEVRLKAAVIDRLYEKALVDADSVLISEMVVDNWSHRADVVLANGRLWGFELKSASDNLARLPSQIEAFNRTFEKFTVVVAERFETAVRPLLPEGVGLWVQASDGELKERIRPRISILSKAAALSLMTASEIRALLACNGCTGIGNMNRQQLEAKAAGLPTADLSSAARDAVKRKHRKKHQNFQLTRPKVGTAAALHALHSYRGARAAIMPPVNDTPRLQGPIEEILNHPAIKIAPAGPVLKRIAR
jgi:hypothetical protein